MTSPAERLRRVRARAVREMTAAARSLPAPVKRAGRKVIASVPDSRVSRRVRAAVLRSPQQSADLRRFHERAARRMIPLNAAGENYEDAQRSTFLQMEAAAMRTRLFELTAGDPASADVLTGEQAVEPLDGAAEGEELAFADEYLRLQQTSPDAVRHLVIVNVYPRPGAEYGNGFVHRRILAYQASGVDVDVVAVDPNHDPEITEYEGVRALWGRGAGVRRLLSEVAYRSGSVHSLSPYIWDQIEPSLAGHRLFCFMHGFESRRWIRTLHNFRDAAAVQAAIADTLQRQRMWRRVLAHPVGAAGYVFVSNWWRRASQEDMEVVFPASRSHVVHNIVDEDLFAYRPKDPDQRFRILWVRSAQSLNYGSDLAVAVLKALRETKWWDQLSVRIIGDGNHFGEFERELGDCPNVRIEQRYASQDEIASLHKDYGVFLVPTRWDSQGVSRDEAMSSGLVPVTNRVCAIEEFVDEDCAVLADPEDVDAMVAGIIDLFKNPDRFRAMSEAAAKRVRAQSGSAHSVRREMAILGLLADDIAAEGGAR